MQLADLAPWDALPYLQPISVKTISLPGSGNTQIVQADPNRWGLIIWTASASGQAFLIGPSSSVGVGSNLGMVIQQQVGGMPILYPTWGVFVCAEWWGQGGMGGSNIFVAELKLRRWPAPGDDPLASIRHPLHKEPKVKLAPGPGRNGSGVGDWFAGMIEVLRRKKGGKSHAPP